MTNHRFVSRACPPEGVQTPAYWFAFQGDKLLMRTDGDRARVPLVATLDELGLAPLRRHYLGYFQDAQGRHTHCYCAEVEGPEGASWPAGLLADGLRQLYPQLGDALFALAGRAIQVVEWDRTHQFCGRCGSAMMTVENERAKKCPRCGLSNYPRLSPAIIIAVVRHTEAGARLLLARNHRHPSGRYSVLAGFVEPGESLEECAEREIMEEVGIRIKNIRYVASQPWPFPNSLMIGFTAEYDAGELVLEQSELADAQWFAADNLPEIPPKMTIARRLIDRFVDENGKRE
jgi:NAD+ diphosphatase